MPASLADYPVLVKKLRADAVAPARATPGSAGLDVCAAEEVVVRPGQRAPVPTGIALAIATGWEVQVRPRSGLARGHGITVLNSPGTIDSNYRQEVVVILQNHGTSAYRVQKGDRVAQLVASRLDGPAAWPEVDELPAPEEPGRDGGFGSTGK